MLRAARPARRRRPGGVQMPFAGTRCANALCVPCTRCRIHRNRPSGPEKTLREGPPSMGLLRAALPLGDEKHVAAAALEELIAGNRRFVKASGLPLGLLASCSSAAVSQHRPSDLCRIAAAQMAAAHARRRRPPPLAPPPTRLRTCRSLGNPHPHAPPARLLCRASRRAACTRTRRCGSGCAAGRRPRRWCSLAATPGCRPSSSSTRCVGRP